MLGFPSKGKLHDGHFEMTAAPHFGHFLGVTGDLPASSSGNARR